MRQKDKKMRKEEVLEWEGVVVQNLSNGLFRVQLLDPKLKSEYFVLAHISGKIRIKFIRIIVGDRVRLEMTPYDVSRGRIIYRFPRKKN